MLTALLLACAMVAVPAAATAQGAPQSASQDLAAYRWKARPLIVVAPTAEAAAFRRQMTLIQADRPGLAERDMVVLTVTTPDDPLRRTLNVPAGAFQVILVGKDGHIAERWTAPAELSSAFALIDRMPMRREEMRRGQ
ncbi:DUF4174 domain-containing protein [Aquabacter spiritensis]|uniref:Uncharacterized protein DUF4174 n=1 Tax=Aquabacter spiritensis TaxID=933073 RepID=A0A4R3LZR4_9HYPH|nr:DUF4174 domain-containing protein [Aquabacter spiritensis]TCT05953.1 uncharacterized protein DUF4174 [Aquabacter spiritensis]